MEPENPKPKIEPPPTFTTQDAISVIVVSLVVGAVIFGGIYYLSNLLKRGTAEKAAQEVAPVPPTLPSAREQKPQFIATQIKPPAAQMVAEQNQKAALSARSTRPLENNPNVDDLLSLPGREDYDRNCSPGYYGHNPCQPGQSSLFPDFVDTVKK